MNEANQNANSFDAESLWHEPSDRQDSNESAQSSIGDDSQPLTNPNSTAADITSSESTASSTATMNWQRVAHKLREYNRKLLKKVFRLEQELAEINNKFDKYSEKSKNSDMLLVQQAEQLENYQEQIAVMTEQLATSQQQLEERELTIGQVSEQHKLSLQQAAQLERECTLLQEKYNQKAFEVVAREKENQELQSELSQQQHTALQQSAKLKRYEAAASRKEKADRRHQNYPHNRFIQPWSNSTIPEPKIALPKTRTSAKKTHNNSETIKTAAEIATWSASMMNHKAKPQPSSPATASKATNKTKKNQPSKKPQSLAAVDLPTFPRPQ